MKLETERKERKEGGKEQRGRRRERKKGGREVCVWVKDNSLGVEEMNSIEALIFENAMCLLTAKIWI